MNGILFKFNKSSTVTLKRKLENIIDVCFWYIFVVISFFV